MSCRSSLLGSPETNYSGNKVSYNHDMQQNLGKRTNWDTGDAPRYTRGLIIAAACAIAGAVVILAWKILYRVFSNGDGGVEVVDKREDDSEV